MTTQVIQAADVTTIMQFCAQEVPKGYIDTEENGKLLIQTLADNTPITLESLSAAAQALRAAGHTLYKSAAQMQFEKVVMSLHEGTRATIHSWLQGQKRLKQDGDEGYLNVVALVSFLVARRYPITTDSLSMALTNLVNNSSSKLYWNEVQETYKPGVHSGKTFSDPKKDETAGDFVGGRINHARNPKIVEQSFSPKALDREWEVKAEALAGQTHSQTAQVKRFLVTKSNGEVDWKATYDSRVRYLEGRNGERTM